MSDDEIKSEACYRTELDKNGAIAFVPSGNSMWPILKNKGQSVVVVKKTGRLGRYDVALYERPGGVYVLHRVMKSEDDGYVICGDSQFSLERVKEDQVFGVMTGFYRGKKYVPCTDEKYKKKVENWYKRVKLRKLRLKFFYLRVRFKNLLGRIFGGKTKKSRSPKD